MPSKQTHGCEHNAKQNKRLPVALHDGNLHFQATIPSEGDGPRELNLLVHSGTTFGFMPLQPYEYSASDSITCMTIRQHRERLALSRRRSAWLVGADQIL